MKALIPKLCLIIGAALLAATAFGQKLAPNQTLGFGAGKLLRLTYTQSFACVDQPNDDLDYNGIKAASDPGEFQTPICQVGTQPTINPPGQIGNPAVTTEPLFVLVPMFSVNNDQNPNDAIGCNGVVSGTICGPALGNELISLFGAVPEAFKTTPLVYTQCPDPGLPAGTCTMHASRLDLGPALAALGLIPPPTSNIFLPTPNHSHVVIAKDTNLQAIWWQVVPVLVFSQDDWPPKDGSSGITSADAIKAAIQAGDAAEVPSNFFLFFSTYTVSKGSGSDMKMPGMVMDHAPGH